MRNILIYIIITFIWSQTKTFAQPAQPDTVKDSNPTLEFYGDLRVRAEFDDRTTFNRKRGRLRFRLGATYTFHKALTLNFRLATTPDPDNPKSTHINFDDGFETAQLGLDQAYLSFSPKETDFLKIRIGKFPYLLNNSNLYKELVWDGDINPEGIDFQFYNLSISDRIELGGNAGLYFPEEIFSNTQNRIYTGQLNFVYQANKNHKFTIGSGFSVHHNIKDRIVPASGYLSNPANQTISQQEVIGMDTLLIQRYTNDFQLFESYLNYSFSHVLVKAQSIINIGAENENFGYALGVQYGNVESKGDWSFYYQFQKVEQEAVFSAFTQDDFLHSNNFQAHVFDLKYGLSNNFYLEGWFYVGKNLILDEWENRIRFDINCKF